MSANHRLESVVQDVGYAARSLGASPMFTILAVATLAIGIGATTAIFSTVNATLLRPLPYARASDLVDVRTRIVDGRVTTGFLSNVEIGALSGLHDIVERVAAASGQPFDATLVRDHGAPVGVLMTWVTEGFFDIVGLPMTRGRAFTHDEHVPGGRDAPLAVILSHHAWTTLFGSDPGVIGATLRVAEAPITTTVVGIASPALDLPHGTDLWLNARMDPQDVAHGFDGIVRLRSGATLARLRSAGAVAMTGLARTVPSDNGREYVMRPLVSSLVGDLGPMLLIVFGATTLLLALACVNVTNLLLARGMARTREMAVRTALGASRTRVVRQLLTESMVLAAAGAVAGLLLAWAAVRVLLLFGASTLPRLDTVPFDGRVLLFALAVLLFSGLVMGLAPAWRLAGTDIRSLVNESGRSATSGGATSRIMSGLIVAEVALAIALVAGAGWLVQSFARVRATEPGFTAEGRLVIDVRPARTFKEPAESLAWSDEMLSRVRAAAGGGPAGSTSSFPLQPDRDGALNVELQSEAPDPNRVTGGHIHMATPGFFEASGIKVLAGRTFTADDRKNTQRVVVVNRAFVRRFLGDRDPLIESMAYGYPTVDRRTMSRIIGVVEDVRYKSLAEAAEPTYYLPSAQADYPLQRQTVVVTARGVGPDALVASIRAELVRFDPHMLMTFTTAPQIVAATLARQELGMTLMLIFGATALALAAIGIYGVIAYAAAQRRGELATRIALGAPGRHVFWLLMSAGQRLVFGGLLLGLAAAYAGGRVVASSVFEMRAADPVVLVAAGGIVAAIAGLATVVPAIRASRLNPVRALRSE
jgi:putative ABC transport system permease protein